MRAALKIFEQEMSMGRCEEKCPYCIAQEKAIEAIKKQIPIELHRQSSEPLICPKCGFQTHTIETEFYCFNCGQKIGVVN